MIENPHNLPKVRSKKLLAACAFMPCTPRISSFIPGHKCSPQNTVIPAHLPVFGKGVNTKVTDMAVCAACFNCHDLMDGRDPRWSYLMENYPAAVMSRLLNALVETHARAIGMKLIRIDGAKML